MPWGIALVASELSPLLARPLLISEVLAKRMPCLAGNTVRPIATISSRTRVTLGPRVLWWSRNVLLGISGLLLEPRLLGRRFNCSYLVFLVIITRYGAVGSPPIGRWLDLCWSFQWHGHNSRRGFLGCVWWRTIILDHSHRCCCASLLQQVIYLLGQLLDCF